MITFSLIDDVWLSKLGFNVTAVFMTNWDLANEKGQCLAESDFEDATYACKKLDIPLVRKNFVKEYWNNVFRWLQYLLSSHDMFHKQLTVTKYTSIFSEFLSGYENNLTPNPDILCNKHIKFGALYQSVVTDLKADALATGHYAQNSYGNFLEHPHKGTWLNRVINLLRCLTLGACWSGFSI